MLFACRHSDYKLTKLTVLEPDDGPLFSHLVFLRHSLATMQRYSFLLYSTPDHVFT